MKKTFFGAGVMAVASTMTVLSAAPGFAQSLPALGSGVENLAACDGGTATYVRAKGDDAKHTITKYVATLVNAGGQEVGAQDLFTYTNPPTGFSNYLVQFLDDGVTRNNVKVHFCFQNSAGEVTGVSKKLSKFSLHDLKDGWTFASIDAAAFGFTGDANGQVLTKVTFSLSEVGNITLGQTRSDFTTVSFSHDKKILPTVGIALINNLNMTNTDCSVLDNCKDVK